ncbi:hypothetical protein Z043_118568, partial [Scleropages formosus]
PPKFLRTPNDQTGVQGGVASFICQATGDPRPKIVWNKKGKKVSNQRFEVIEFDDGSGSVLRIQPLRTPRDEAIYECVASNSVGEISASTRLNVLRGRFSFPSTRKHLTSHSVPFQLVSLTPAPQVRLRPFLSASSPPAPLSVCPPLIVWVFMDMCFHARVDHTDLSVEMFCRLRPCAQSCFRAAVLSHSACVSAKLRQMWK